MNDYTPTPQEAREYYVSMRRMRNETIAQHYMGAPVPDYGREFDRMLDKVRGNAQNEPTKFGHVGTITGSGGTWDVFRTDDDQNPYQWVCRIDGATGISTWANIPWRETFEGSV